MANMTDLLNSTSLTPTDGGSAFIRPTPVERRMGRLMRAPDHDAGAGEGGDAAGSGDQGGADGDGGDAGDQGAKADAGAGDGGEKGDEGKGGDSSLMGDAGAKKEGDGEDDKAKAEAAELPEKYELTAPEGLEINDEVLAEIDPVFRDLKLNNEQANKVIALAGPFAERIQQQAIDQHLATATTWAKEAKDDPDIGKGNWPETDRLVAKALDRFAGPSKKDANGAEQNPLRAILNDSKLGNHPAMIRAWRDIGRAVSEDTDFVRPDAGAAEKKDRLAELYPDDVPKVSA